MTTKYDNTDWFRLARTGGVLSVTLGAGGVGRGNDGVSLPCRGCFVQIRGDADVWIDDIDGAGLGPFIPGAAVGHQPMWIPISDVAQLYFGGSNRDIVDIIYLLG